MVTIFYVGSPIQVQYCSFAHRENRSYHITQNYHYSTIDEDHHHETIQVYFYDSVFIT